MRAQILCAAALVLVVAESATAAPARTRPTILTVQLQGVQKTTWEHHHLAEGGCDVPIDGSGSETYRFRSAKLRVTAIATPSGVVLTTTHGEPLLVLTGTVTRQGVVNVGSGEVCAYGDGSGESDAPRPPDCGIRKVRSTAAIGFAGPTNDVLILAPGLTTPKDPFASCPTGAPNQFPGLETFADGGQYIGRRLPASDLLRHGRNVVVAQGSRTQKGSERTSTTSIQWTATFTRVSR